MRCGRVGLQDRSATRRLFLRGNLPVVNRCLKHPLAAEQSGVERVCRARITDDGHVIL
jgi:hypothetical protein